jgi:hypothetical protein
MKFKEYFALLTDEPAFSARKTVAQEEGTLKKAQPIFFIGVLAGALAKVIYDHFMSGVAFHWGHLVAAAIGSIVSFPAIYNAAGLKRRGDMSLAKWCVAFQHGFFWQVVMQEIGKKTGGV